MRLVDQEMTFSMSKFQESNFQGSHTIFGNKVGWLLSHRCDRIPGGELKRRELMLTLLLSFSYQRDMA